MKEVGGGGRSLAGGGGFVGVDLDKADKRPDTHGEENVPDDIVGGELQNGCFESGYDLSAEGCGHEVSQGGGCEAELRRTGWRTILLR